MGFLCRLSLGVTIKRHREHYKLANYDKETTFDYFDFHSFPDE
jgi:hypothetical protein